MGRLTTLDFIERARQVHYDKYDYSQVEYVNNSTKVRIICPEHGEFEQTPGNHWAGKKCSKCAVIQRAKKKTKTNEQFIEEAWDVHGDFYDYSLVEYAGQNSEVKIICPVHGEFLQKPKIHLRGNGCKECGFETIIRKKTKNKGYFITKARLVHGDHYDYSKVEYQGAEKNGTIICQLHGKFLQSPGNHYAGKGCPACSGLARYDNIRFIEKARRAHGDKYGYSNVNVVNGHTKVQIICPNHGKFSQEVRHHVRGVGCPECKKVSISEALTKSTDDFISEARVIHGDTYNYAKVDYIAGREDVTIICPVHGEFQQQPRTHLQESGCPKSGEFIGADVRRKTTEQFVTDAIKTHKNKYDYSLVEYRGAFEKVKIICPEHGVFEQFAGGHIGGSNCPSCAYTGVTARTDSEDLTRPI